MLCYKDMTFCSFWEDCKKQENCSRCLTENVRIDSDRSGLLICQFVDKPNCFEGINNS